MYLDRCLAEIEERLGGITNSLGLSHTLYQRTGGEDYFLFFERADEDGVIWSSPVSFRFPHESVSGLAVLAMENAMVGLGESTVKEIGTNGWIWFPNSYIDREGLPIGTGTDIPSVEAAFSRAARGLLKQVPFPEGEVARRVVSKHAMGEFWPSLRKQCRARGILQIEVWQEDYDVQGFSFLYLGSEVKLSFGRNVRLEIDGATVSSVDEWAFSELSDELQCGLAEIRETAGLPRR